MRYSFEEYKRPEILKGHLNLGGINPEGECIDVNSLFIERNGKPYLGVMGEYHFSRDKRENWYTELCKMKAGGVNIVATYLFWIYHEEIEGEFDFSGALDIRAFILEAKRAGLETVIRIGPWAHGECRNGGLPDWILKKSYGVRQNNPEYLEKARIWYERVFEQVRGLFYKDGGSIIGIQIENELVNNSEHIAELKRIAVEIGYDAPLWTATGWNSKYGARLPVDEVLPVFGAYPDAPWDGRLTQLLPSPHYAFNTQRNDSAIGLDVINPTAEDGWRLPLERYPFVTCEIGGGMQVTHHRRPVITGMDIYALSLCKLGDGNNLIGYYMYKGGTHRMGKLSTMQETKATGYPNDYAALSYDFQAPISEYGEIREQYRLVNFLHMFVNDFGDILAPMSAVMARPQIKADDFENLRLAMRTDGKSGFVFVNHYQRLHKLKDVHDAVIEVCGTVFPPIDVVGEISFIMPFGILVCEKALDYATAQLLCKVGEVYFFAEIPEVDARIRFEGDIERKLYRGVNDICGVCIVLLSWDEARFARKINGKLYIGENCDVYEADGIIRCVQDGNFSYRVWNGSSYDSYSIEVPFKQAELTMCDSEAEFEPTEKYELEIGGKRALTYKKLKVDGVQGFIELTGKYDCAQLYTDGKLVADNFNIGTAWRLPASLLYGKECILVMSESKEDHYSETRE